MGRRGEWNALLPPLAATTTTTKGAPTRLTIPIEACGPGSQVLCACSSGLVTSVWLLERRAGLWDPMVGPPLCGTDHCVCRAPGYVTRM